MITRRRGVFYKDGRPVPDTEQQQCRKIGIPPAYTDVVVYLGNPKLVATAIDGTGKKHYYYNDKFLEKQRKLRKGRATHIDFSKIKSVTARILSDPKHPLWDDALTLRMIAIAYLRSGSRDNDDAIGAMSLRRKHVKLSRDGQTLTFDFPAKSGQQRFYEVRDKVLHDAISRQQKPLLSGNSTHNRVRDLLRKITGNGDIQIKDIRTAGSMQLFQKHLKKYNGDEKKATDATAETIGHTPSVSKKYYLL
jgi:DNA topoisomerase IB